MDPFLNEQRLIAEHNRRMVQRARRQPTVRPFLREMSRQALKNARPVNARTREGLRTLAYFAQFPVSN